MVKLDVSLLRYLSADEIRVLTAVEMGQKNHEIVPTCLVATIAALKSGVSKILHQLSRHKLISYERGKRFDGYRLTYKGYDYLALNVLRNREVITEIGTQIGVGKESDVFLATNGEQQFVLKLHRLGRICFRRVNDKRDYQKNGNKVHSFLYLSRLAAKREFAFMSALHEKGFPVPKPVDCNRHCVVMELIDGAILNNLTPEDVGEVDVLYDKLMNLIMSMANEYGVVHGDFNEFNLMLNKQNEPILIDFPQMVGTNHHLAQEYFERDVHCIVDFFKKRFNYVSDYIPTLNDDVVIRENKATNKIIVEEDEDEEGEYEEAVEFEVDATVKVESELLSRLNKLQVEHNVDGYDHSANDQSEHDSSKNDISEKSDENSILSFATKKSISASTVASSFAPEDIRKKLRSQREKKEQKSKLKKATHKVKGEANATRRERRNNIEKIKDDMKIHKIDPF